MTLSRKMTLFVTNWGLENTEKLQANVGNNSGETVDEELDE